MIISSKTLRGLEGLLVTLLLWIDESFSDNKRPRMRGLGQAHAYAGSYSRIDQVGFTP
jgi:hypothetical protein